MSDPPTDKRIPNLALSEDADRTVLRQTFREGSPVARRDRPYLIVIAGGTVGEMLPITSEETVMGRAADATIRFEDNGVSRRHACIRYNAQRVEIEDLGSANGTFVNGRRIDGRQALADGDKITLGSVTVLKFTYNDALDERFQRQMFEASFRDALTGAYNKKYLLERMAKEIAYAMRHREPLSLVMVDVDHFKSVNDRFGHPAGDAVLAQTAKTVLETVRKEDVFARYGGEEFAVLCRGTDVIAAARLAERLRSRIAAARTAFQDTNIAVTASFGIATLLQLPTPEPEALVAAADQALYEAKRAGRNRVHVHTGAASTL